MAHRCRLLALDTDQVGGKRGLQRRPVAEGTCCVWTYSYHVGIESKRLRHTLVTNSRLSRTKQLCCSDCFYLSWPIGLAHT